jgi:hypothetical protein
MANAECRMPKMLNAERRGKLEAGRWKLAAGCLRQPGRAGLVAEQPRVHEEVGGLPHGPSL